MALTKTTSIDKIEVLPTAMVQVRVKTTAFDDDGTLIGERYFRYVLAPGDDVASQPLPIKRVCNATWVAAVVTAYQSAVAAGNPPPVQW